jgi:Taurine catabolism dioxygenase TauD, TfdA family
MVKQMSFVLTDREEKFVSQAEEYLEKALGMAGKTSLTNIESITGKAVQALRPIIVNDYRELSRDVVAALSNAYHGDFGVAYCIVLNHTDAPILSHPLLDLAVGLADDLNLHFPLKHPMEGHAEAVSRFGPPDSTLKIYDLDTKDGSTGYREQAETSDMFSAHNDGLGYGGAVKTVAFYMDSAPAWGGFTYFQNIVRLSLELASIDYEAFRSLFLPNAITALRPRGKGAIKVVSPVLFLNTARRPQCFYRVSTGEYQITWRTGSAALDRAREFMAHHTHPFAPASTFVHMTAPGHCCFVRNEATVHGRTPFLDLAALGQRRVLARKWFMESEEETVYKHVPGMDIYRDYADLYPELFGRDRSIGEWNYDKARDENIRFR